MRYLLALVLAVSATLSAGDAPEIAVSRNSVDVPDGGNETVYGTIQNQAFTQTWSIANEGAAALTLAAPVIGALTNCAVTVTTAPTTSVAANSSTTMVLQITPSTASWSFTVSIANNDSSENPMNWTVSGTADASATVEVAMTRNGADVADGSTDSITGSVALVWETLTYTIHNRGSATLNLSASQIGTPTNALGEILVSPAATVAPGLSTQLILRVRPTTGAAWSVPVQYTTNDSSENPYNWTISGTADAFGPEAAISRSGAGIADGSVYNGPGGSAGSPMDLTFTLANAGSATMTASAPTIGTQVNCTAQVVVNPISPVVANSSTTFTVRIVPASNATWTAGVSVGTSDANENPYDFTIRGTASASGSNGDGDNVGGGGGCGAGGAVAGLLVALGLLSLRRRR